MISKSETTNPLEKDNDNEKISLSESARTRVRAPSLGSIIFQQKNVQTIETIGEEQKVNPTLNITCNITAQKFKKSARSLQNFARTSCGLNKTSQQNRIRDNSNNNNISNINDQTNNRSSVSTSTSNQDYIKVISSGYDPGRGNLLFPAYPARNIISKDKTNFLNKANSDLETIENIPIPEMPMPTKKQIQRISESRQKKRSAPPEIKYDKYPMPQNQKKDLIKTCAVVSSAATFFDLAGSS